MELSFGQLRLCESIKRFTMLWEKMLNFKDDSNRNLEMDKEQLMIDFVKAYKELDNLFLAYKTLFPFEDWIINVNQENVKGGRPESLQFVWEGLQIMFTLRHSFLAKDITSITFGKNPTIFFANLNCDE